MTLRHSDSDHTSRETKSSTSATSKDENGGWRQVKKIRKMYKRNRFESKGCYSISLGGIRRFFHLPPLDLPQMANCCIHLYLFIPISAKGSLKKVEIPFGVDIKRVWNEKISKIIKVLPGIEMQRKVSLCFRFFLSPSEIHHESSHKSTTFRFESFVLAISETSNWKSKINNRRRVPTDFWIWSSRAGLWR